jgi:hypothetical protein
MQMEWDVLGARFSTAVCADELDAESWNRIL